MVGIGERLLRLRARQRELAVLAPDHVGIYIFHELSDRARGDLHGADAHGGCGNGDIDARRRCRHVLCTQLRREHEGAVFEGIDILPVGQIICHDRLLQGDGDLVPRADVHGEEAVLRLALDRRAVDEDRKVLRPFGAAQAQGRRAAVDMNGDLVRIFKVGGLRQGDGVRRIRRIEVERDIGRIACIVIDAVVQLGEALHAAARAAPEVIFRRGVHLEVARRHGLEVGRHARFGVLRRPDRIIVRPLVEIEVFDVLGDGKEHARELEHVVCIARLAVGVGALRVEDVVPPEVLPFGIAARHIGMMLHDALPEQLRRIQIVDCDVFQLRNGRRLQRDKPVEQTDDLGNGRVGVLAVQIVGLLAQNAVDQALFVKLVRRNGIARVPRHPIEVVEAVVHAAVFDTEHDALRGIRPLTDALIHPVAQLDDDGERLFVASERVRVEQSRDDLVHRVPRHPRLGIDIRSALLHVIELDLDIGIVDDARAPQEALFRAARAVVIFLTLRERIDDIVQLVCKLFPILLRRARIGDRLRERRQVVPHRVPADQCVLPAAAIAG